MPINPKVDRNFALVNPAKLQSLVADCPTGAVKPGPDVVRNVRIDGVANLTLRPALF
jgi:hypothetical protein